MGHVNLERFCPNKGYEQYIINLVVHLFFKIKLCLVALLKSILKIAFGLDLGWIKKVPDCLLKPLYSGAGFRI